MTSFIVEELHLFRPFQMFAISSKEIKMQMSFTFLTLNKMGEKETIPGIWLIGGKLFWEVRIDIVEGIYFRELYRFREDEEEDENFGAKNGKIRMGSRPLPIY